MIAAAEFRRACAQFVTGITVVSTVTGDQPHAATVNSFTSVSVDPPLVLVCLRKGGRIAHRIARSGSFAVTVLGGGQRELALRLADPRRVPGAAEFAGPEWLPAPRSAAPVHREGLGYFDCVVHQRHDAGDHDIVIGRVTALSLLSDDPQLVFSRSSISTFG